MLENPQRTICKKVFFLLEFKIYNLCFCEKKLTPKIFRDLQLRYSQRPQLFSTITFESGPVQNPLLRPFYRSMRPAKLYAII